MRITLPSGTPAEHLDTADHRLGVVVIPDIGGLRPLFDGIVQRLATEHGWPAVAVEPWPGREHLTLEERLEAVGSLHDDRVLGDVAAAADLLACDRTAVIGFCMGGMYTLKAAGTGRFDRAVSFYGMIRVPEQWRSPHQGEPLELLARDRGCPVLAIVGTADVWTPAHDIAALEQVENVEVVRYAGAEHGFVHDPDRPAHRPDDAADAWRRATELIGSGSPAGDG